MCPKQDHPRSRGVYVAPATARYETAGSSPLARGLPPDGVECGGTVRIIPARAGFTGHSVFKSVFPEDHPRSRGVYSPCRGGRTLRTGSSPLARGLRALERIGAVDRGIIPARAGFTASPRRVRVRTGDHPRSRGVYTIRVGTFARSIGSSPLARGLQLTNEYISGEMRIIPARAGFT